MAELQHHAKHKAKVCSRARRGWDGEGGREGGRKPGAATRQARPLLPLEGPWAGVLLASSHLYILKFLSWSKITRETEGTDFSP